MAALSVTAFDAFLKEVYAPGVVGSLAIKNRPLLEWVNKKDAFYGDTYVQPVLYEDPQSVSSDISSVLTNNSNTQQDKFVSTARRALYGATEIDGEVLLAASKDFGSFLKAKQPQIDGMLRQLGKTIHTDLYRDGTGVIGQINSSYSSGATVTLTNPTDAHHFGVGQRCVSSTTTSGGTANTVTTVAGTDPVAGTVTFSDDVSGLGSAWAADDYIFPEGDYDTSSGLGNKIRGLSGWLPLAAPSSTAWFGVDRTQHITRFSGARVDNSGRSILENALELAMLIGEENGSGPDAMFCNPRAGLQLAQEAGAEVMRSAGGKADLGFNGFVLHSHMTGPIEVRFDYACPQNRAYMLRRDALDLVHMGPCPHLIMDTGRAIYESSSADQIQLRGRFFGELIVKKPGACGVMSVATS